MKNILKQIVILILFIEAKMILWRYRPKIIAVTGSVGKTSAKDLIYTSLKSSFHIRKNQKSLNSEIGVPLTILGLDSGWNSPKLWLKNIIIGLIQVFYHPNYPDWLVLEFGVDRPGDMKRVASWVRPDIAIFTSFGKVPVHVEFFDSPEHVMEEKAVLLKYVRKGGAIILNADDENVIKLKNKATEKVYTYGIKEPADIQASNYSIVYDKFGRIKLPTGISFKINYDGNVVPVSLNGVLGEQYVYPALIAVSTGLSVGANMVSASKDLSEYKASPGRMNLIEGRNKTMIIDDTYNASPLATQKAIETLGEISTNGEKIAVLGDMLEIGRFSSSEHRKIGALVVKNKIDILVAVGMRAEQIADEAMINGMSKDKIFVCDDSRQAVPVVKQFLKDKNIILVKGSQGIRAERIVKEIMKEPDRRKELLVRQEPEWQKR